MSAAPLPLSEIRMQGPDVCKCGHKETDHTKHLTHCTHTHPGPATPGLYNDAEIAAMQEEEKYNRFGVVFCECMTFRSRGAIA